MVQCPGSRLPLAIRLQRRATLAGCFVNSVSATMLVVYMTVVFPPSADDVIVPRDVSLVAVAVYVLIAGVTFYRNAQPEFGRMRRWLAEGRSPTPDERAAVMRLPVLFARMTLVRWLLAVPLFALPDLFASREFALEEAVTTLLAGLSTSAAVYLTSGNCAPRSRWPSTARRRPRRARSASARGWCSPGCCARACRS